MNIASVVTHLNLFGRSSPSNTTSSSLSSTILGSKLWLRLISLSLTNLFHPAENLALPSEITKLNFQVMFVLNAVSSINCRCYHVSPSSCIAPISFNICGLYIVIFFQLHFGCYIRISWTSDILINETIMQQLINEICKIRFFFVECWFKGLENYINSTLPFLSNTGSIIWYI